MVKFGVITAEILDAAAYHAAEGGHVHCMRQIAERKLGTKVRMLWCCKGR